MRINQPNVNSKSKACTHWDYLTNITLSSSFMSPVFRLTTTLSPFKQYNAHIYTISADFKIKVFLSWNILTEIHHIKKNISNKAKITAKKIIFTRNKNYIWCQKIHNNHIKDKK